MAVFTVTEDNFKTDVLESSSPVLLDFYADWCPPCRKLSPLVDEVSEERLDIRVGKVNVDDEQELAAKFGVQNIPTLVVIKNGKQTASSVGAVPKEDIIKLLEM